MVSLNEYYDLSKGAELGLSLARVALKTRDQNSKKWFAPISSFIVLTDEQKNDVIKLLKLSNELRELKQALIPLISFYPTCPLAFLFEGKVPNFENSKENLEQFKLLLSGLFNRWEKRATLVQASAIYIAFATDLLQVAKGSALANFPAVAEFPNTEESRGVSASVRAAVNQFFGTHFYDSLTTWPSYFWNRGLELEPCDYQGVYEPNE